MQATNELAHLLQDVLQAEARTRLARVQLLLFVERKPEEVIGHLNKLPLIPAKAVLEQRDWRSTSMGDYVRVVDEDGVESFWRCCAVGWNVITDREDLKRVQDAAIFAGI